MVDNIDIIFKNQKTRDHWIRRGIALFIDIVILLGLFFLSMVLFILLLLFTHLGPRTNFNANGILMAGAGVFFLMFFTLITLIISTFYFVGLELKFGGTLGKKLMKLQVVPTEGAMDISKVILRNLAKLGGILLGCMLGNFLFVFGGIIGFLIVDTSLGFGNTPDPRQKYSDIMANTTVVRTDIEENIDDMTYIPPVPTQAVNKSAAETKQEISTTSPDIDLHQGEMSIEPLPTWVKKYSDFFEINEARALNLYNSGYKCFEDFKDAIVEDLVMVNEINPTTARVIVNKISNGTLPED